jgi:CDP-diacylglycerol--glycerol-3-phosphate 3-phosphatidyltransferase
LEAIISYALPPHPALSPQGRGEGWGEPLTTCPLEPFSLTFLSKMLCSLPKISHQDVTFQKMIGNKIGHRLDPYLYYVLKIFLGEHGNPNFFTLMGFFATLVASLLLLKELWFFAGLAIILSGLFDLFDGVVARKLGKVTTFGSFLDSVLDRYSDLLFLLALLIHYLKKEEPNLVILTSFVSMGIALIPYVRAKAEALQVPCNIGIMERAERIILLSIGTLFQWMVPILWILAILTHFTVLHRIYYVWKKLRS